jgi:hypothetical protein
VLQNAANAGVDFFGNVKSSFESGLVDLLSFDGDIEDVLKSFVGSFAMAVIQSFAKGFSDRLFEGVLGTSMESLGSELVELGAGALGGLFGGKSEEVAGSKTGDYTGSAFSIWGSYQMPKAASSNPFVSPEATGEAAAEGLLGAVDTGVQEGLGGIADLFGERGLMGLVQKGLSAIGGMFSNMFRSILGSLGGGGGGTNWFGMAINAVGSYFSGGIDFGGAAGTAASKINLSPLDSMGSGWSAYATGGLIKGPGTGTSDSIAAWVSNGEFIVNAKAAKQNLGLLHALNSGQMPAFATGGLVNEGASISAPSTINTSAIRSGMPEQNSGGQTVINLTVTGDISRQTKSEIYKMLPNIAQGVNQYNANKGHTRGEK